MPYLFVMFPQLLLLRGDSKEGLSPSGENKHTEAPKLPTVVSSVEPFHQNPPY
ncbi:hypothetical protein HanIR_Chr04g0161731 [Helianthus annuus]|nr:hypothetical protein HanIR_Chr04g0161731 [Helianthus annuus]